MHKNMQMGVMSDAEQKKQSAQQRREAREGMNKAALITAALFGGSLLQILNDTVLGTKRVLAISSRKPEEVVAELNRFYTSRPRPWRAHMNRRSVRAALVRRRVAAAKRDKEIFT